MPNREDEYWAGTKEPVSTGLCPFCGSPKVYYNKQFRSWRCGRCEKSFRSPSYGPGGARKPSWLRRLLRRKRKVYRNGADCSKVWR